MSCKSSTYFEPTTVQRKHACPGTSKYGNISRRRYKNNDEAISGSNRVTYAGQPIQTTPTQQSTNIGQ